MQMIALTFIVGFAFVFHLYLCLVATAAASLVKLTISQWCIACFISSFFVIAGIVLSADREELVIDAPKTQIIFQDKKVERPTDSSTEMGMLAYIWSITVLSVESVFLPLIAGFDGGTILFLCIVHNVAIWLAVGVLTALFNFKIALVTALFISVGITFLTRKVRKVGS